MNKSFRTVILKILGQKLKEIRTEKGITTADVALHSDLSIKSINEIEKGNKVAFDKYFHLLTFYNKKLDIVIKDK